MKRKFLLALIIIFTLTITQSYALDIRGNYDIIIAKLILVILSAHKIRVI